MPEGFRLFSYATIYAFAQGIELAGPDDQMKVAEALKDGKQISAVVGNLVLHEKGDFKNASYDINQWHDGQVSAD